LVIKHRKRIEVRMDAFTAELMQARFGYIFSTPPGSQYPPLLDPGDLRHGQASAVTGAGGVIEAMPFTLNHGDIDALGFRFGSLAYTPDVVDIPASSIQYLENLDTWIIDALRQRPHPSHFSLDEALDWISRLKPRRAILTNLHTDMDYAELAAVLPAGVEPAYDGMRIMM
ncbi:MAG: MBL fold metallo-hydrolase, partial [Beijerinckiaceae bacterium]|nr:MBL fold metallo-hydrolase [Beijerinckiaceae bacterium]